MPDWITTLTWTLGCVIVLFVGRPRSKGSPYPLPPGPPGIPWLGNVVGINTDAPWVTYAEWGKKYGGIICTRLLGNEIIIINSEKVAKDLLENRSQIYSGRPYLATHEWSGLGFNTVLMPYGDELRLHRRFFHQTFRPEGVSRFLLLQRRKIGIFLRKLLDSPEELDDHVFEYTASVILNSVYNYDPTSRKDELVDMMANVLHIVKPLLRPHIAIIAGTFPFVLRLPSWLPGMSFKRDMASAREFIQKYLEKPFAHALANRDTSGVTSTPSMVNDALGGLEEKGALPDQEWMRSLKWATGTAFLAASDTSHSVIMTFFLMMAANPEVQKRAQEQLDMVTGCTRLPTSDDRHLLPYIDAIFWELLRYCPAVILVPRTAVQDDVYNGFRIPKGVLLLVNAWSMARDESKYPNPHAFMPSRFLNDDGTLKHKSADIDRIAFGFGRRMCTGSHFAETSVWMIISSVLSVFEILPPLDGPVEVRFSSVIPVHPLPFGCRIVPRVADMCTGMLEQWLVACTT